MQTFTLSADGQTGEFVANGNMRVHAIGTFGGGTLTLQQEINGTFEDIQGSAKTADADFVFESLASNSGVFRFDLSGSTTPSVVVTAMGNVRPNKSFV